jgi:hypothetical protein
MLPCRVIVDKLHDAAVNLLLKRSNIVLNCVTSLDSPCLLPVVVIDDCLTCILNDLECERTNTQLVGFVAPS